MKRAARFLVATALALAGAPPLVAEIRQEFHEDEIVATNERPDFRPVPHLSLPVAPPPPAGSAAPPPEIAKLLQTASEKHGFDPALVRAVVMAESGFDPTAVSVKGARGLMQLMPPTAAEYGLRDINDPGGNLDAGLSYLRAMVVRHGGDVRLALAAYNAGPQTVARYGGVPPYQETIRYLETIRRVYGEDLDAGDWSDRSSDIRLSGVEQSGTPHYTNLPPRRILGHAGRTPGQEKAR